MKLIVISFLLYQAYPFKPPIHWLINIHQSSLTGRKLKTLITLASVRIVITFITYTIHWWISGSYKCPAKCAHDYRQHSSKVHIVFLLIIIMFLLIDVRYYGICQTIQSETRFEFWIWKAHQNKLYYYCYLCHLHIIIIYIGMWYIRTYYRTIGRPTVWKKNSNYVVVVPSYSAEREFFKRSDRTRLLANARPTIATAKVSYSNIDDVHTIIVITKAYTIVPYYHTIHYGL